MRVEMAHEEGVLHHLELHRSSDERRSQPDRYDIDLLAQPRWDKPYRVRMQWSGEDQSSGVLSWEFSTMHGALRHMHVLVTRQQGIGYALTRIPRSHPYRAWLDAESADTESPDEDDPQARLF